MIAERSAPSVAIARFAVASWEENTGERLPRSGEGIDRLQSAGN